MKEAGPATDSLFFTPEAPRKLLDQLTEAHPDLREQIAAAAETGASRYKGGSWTVEDLNAFVRRQSERSGTGLNPDGRDMQCVIAKSEFMFSLNALVFQDQASDP